MRGKAKLWVGLCSTLVMMATAVVMLFALSAPALADIGSDETWYDYDHYEDRTLLPMWDGTVDHWVHTWGVDEAHDGFFDGWETEVTNVRIVSQKPDKAGDTVISLRKDANPDEPNEYWWYYQAENYGEATLEVTLVTPDGQQHKETFTLYVDRDVYQMDAHPKDGSYRALPGTTMPLVAEGWHDTDYDPQEIGEESFEFAWEVEADDDAAWIAATVSADASDSSQATLTFADKPNDWNGYYDERVGVRVSMYVKDAQGNYITNDKGERAVVADYFFNVGVTEDYTELYPTLFEDSRVSVGETFTITPEARRYTSEAGAENYEVVEGLRYEAEFDANTFELVSEGSSFTFKRLKPWGSDLRLVAYNSEDERIAERNYWFDNLWFELRFAEDTPHEAYVRTDDAGAATDSVALELDMGDLPASGWDLEVTVGTWEDDDGWTKTYDDACTVSGSTITLDTGKLYRDGAEGVRIEARALMGGEEVAWTDTWLDIRQEEYHYELEPDSTILKGWRWWIPNTYDLFVVNEEHDHEHMPYTVKAVKIVSEVPKKKGDDVIADLDIYYENNDESLGVFYWTTEALNYGKATIGITYVDYFGKEQYYEHTLTVGDEVYSVELRTDGMDRALPGGSIELVATAHHQVIDDNGVAKDLGGDGLTYQWSWETSNPNLSDLATLTPHKDDPSRATLKFGQLPNSDEWPSQEVYPRVSLMRGNEEVATADTWTLVAEEFTDVYAGGDIPGEMTVGETLTLRPELRVYPAFEFDVEGQKVGYTVVTDEQFHVSFAYVDYFNSILSVTDNGDGSFTVKALKEGYSSLNLSARWIDPWGNQQGDFLHNSIQVLPASVNPFIDVTDKTSHADDILWLAESGISTGWDTSAGKEFRPNANVKRGDMAAFLFRLAKQWKVLGASDDWAPKKETKAKFTDVAEGTSHAQAIWWMAENGISAGWDVGGGKAEFRPNADVKRGDLAAFLGRLAEKAGRRGSAKINKKAFLDVTASTAHADEIWWMAASGVSGGWDVKGGKEFRPNNPVKRGDMAAFLHRLDGIG